MTIEEMITVLQGAKEGRVVQARVCEEGEWGDATRPIWDFYRFEYRLKPAPREWWIASLSPPRHPYIAYENPRDAQEATLKLPGTEVIHVREVLDEPASREGGAS